MKNVFDILTERGFIEQTTHEEEIKQLLENEKISFYIGYDPTADSLTIGHFLTVMAMAHMQRAGHRPIVLIGGGTCMVGDPTDKTEMRRVMPREEIEHNANCFKKQLSNFIDFEDNKAIMINNADWLCNLNYLEFMREYGIHFSVNKMLTTDAYKTRLEKGLTFFEFNYMLLQAYDFLELNRRYDCKMQMGGNDQWSNIIAGNHLIRRMENKSTYGMTFSLLTTSEGTKMGKTLKGAIFLDPNKTSPYEFYQYWRNVADPDVSKLLSLLTFLPMEEVNELRKLEGSELNKAKEILAYEITKIVHGEKEAENAQNAARTLFQGYSLEGSVPTTEIPKSEFNEGLDIIDLLEKTKLIESRGDGRRLIQQSGIKIDGTKIDSISHKVLIDQIDGDEFIIQKGKKVFHRVSVYES